MMQRVHSVKRKGTRRLSVGKRKAREKERVMIQKENPKAKAEEEVETHTGADEQVRRDSCKPRAAWRGRRVAWCAARGAGSLRRAPSRLREAHALIEHMVARLLRHQAAVGGKLLQKVHVRIGVEAVEIER